MNAKFIVGSRRLRFDWFETFIRGFVILVCGSILCAGCSGCSGSESISDGAVVQDAPPVDSSNSNNQDSSQANPSEPESPAEDDSSVPDYYGEYRLGSRTCGPGEEGTVIQRLVNGSWSDTGLCMMSDSGQYDELNFGAGYGAPSWDYEQADFPARGMYGWSYYLRAFDLIRDQPVREVGWGQWTKPSAPASGLDVCGIHPHGFVCDEDAPTAAEMAGELRNCGQLGHESLEECRVWCCGEEDKCGVRGSIEGGMGYWMYTLETPHVKWMLPGSTNANYEVFGGTFLNDRQQPCTNLGGAVRIANNFLIPNDFVSFDSDDVDGFMGYMLTKTPIGKRAASDEANYWTIVIDAANFAGPVMYMSSWFWDSRINWHPKSVSWSDPRALIGYVAEGFEGRLGAIQMLDEDGVVWRRTNRWAFPRDVVNGVLVDSSTLFTGHSQYNTDWAADAMEPMLAGTGESAQRRPESIRMQALALGTPPGGGCELPHADSQVALELDVGDEELIWDGFGVTSFENTSAADQLESEAANCHTKLTLNTTKLDCTTEEGWCEGHRYIKMNADGTGREVVDATDVPREIKASLALRRFEKNRQNDGRYLGPPAESEASCFDTPGPAPADPRLYCTRTKSGNWIGFRWYRFVDQPELNQVFASLPLAERDAAKCYMQARIERLHEAQQIGGEVHRWFDVPQGAQALPGPKVALDSALLVTPPAGLEKGFVPISVYERKKVKPADCEVTLGDIRSEPDPLPADYYEGYVTMGGGYDIEICPANLESGGPFQYPGTVFGFSPGDDQLSRTAYSVPRRADVGSTLNSTSVVCGLPSDPPTP